MDWCRPDGSLDVAAFMAHALSLYGVRADRYSVDADTVFESMVTPPGWHLEAALVLRPTA